MKKFEVKITHIYLVEAHCKSDAIGHAQDCMLGRPYASHYFDGMIIDAHETKREMPKYVRDQITQEMLNRGKELSKDFDDYQEVIIEPKKGGKQNNDIKPISKGGRKDTEESDYIHLSPADGV